MRVTSRSGRWFLTGCLAAAGLAAPAAAQRAARDTSGRAAADTSRLAPITVSATRSDVARDRVPNATAVVTRDGILRGRATLDLGEALGLVPGVYVANRYNFSLDDRISIRGFGARSAFAVRGITVLLDGIPQTLPDGQGQLTNLELGESDRIEVLRGSSSALFGNAAGGVISVWSDPVPPAGVSEQLRVTGGAPAEALGRAWSKWLSTTRWRVGDGVAQVTASRLAYDGERQHSAADSRTLNAHLALPVAGAWTLTAVLEGADDPRADNPGSLTAAELAANPDSADALYRNTAAGKWARQAQAGVTLRRDFDGGGAASLTLFGLTRTLRNPQTYAYIDLGRRAVGARASVSRPFAAGGLEQTATAGVDAQWQRDDRTNFGNAAGVPVAPLSLNQLEHVQSVGPFVQDALSLGSRVTVTLGTRYDQVGFRVHDRLVTAGNPDDSGHRLMGAASGSAGVTVRATDAATVYANVGTSFETPTTTELANRPDTAGGFNPTLDPQTAVNYELGVRGRVAPHLTYSAAVYAAEVRGELIAFQVPSSPERSFYRNAGRSRHRGLELGATLAPAPDYAVTVNWTASDFRYTDYVVNAQSLDGRRVPGVPPTWLDALLHARPGGGAWWADAESRYASGYLVDDTKATRTSPWATLDLRMGWDGAAGGAPLHPFVSVGNLFDRRYVSSVVINAAAGRYYEPAPGRTLSFGLSLELGS